ncbi:DUF4105 domain-containing protein [Luteibacter aegosomaticola]|uniref:Lnb N-terminal periplasmic domain-containing protein n=1 Tax=Luteibacter aegosomaticola TaxID=2911538 RepID=UPI001FFA11AE|nr:DUF4105 domain-containing protein [Luteibacter aegosomaticola]UPG91897.1 DUF4105 domain-containing protein [Luteibacter aegosomaticola]
MLARTLAGGAAGLLLFLSGAWGALALSYQLPGPPGVRVTGAVVWSAVYLALLVAFLGWRVAWAPMVLVAMLGVLIAWWTTIQPRNDRVWAPDVARLLSGEIHGDRVTLHNVRDFTWRTDDDADAHWETREYDLSQLVSADAVLSYWSSEAIAHAMLSFGFADGRHVVFSMEIRREKGEAFSEVGGFFKQFELVLIAADERDIIRVRTNVRGEDDYLFPLRMPPEAMRSLFVSYVQAANRLVDEPRFYNTITSNCTTIVYRMARRIDTGLPMDIRLLLTGYLPEYLMDNGALDNRMPVDEWRRLGRITDRARASQPGDDFSAVIRQGVPPAVLLPDAPPSEASPSSGDSTLKPFAASADR